MLSGSVRLRFKVDLVWFCNIHDPLPSNTFHLFQVTNNTLFWNWSINVFVPAIYAGVWYNGLPENQSNYIGDKCSVLVGMPRVRQLRVKSSKSYFVSFRRNIAFEYRGISLRGMVYDQLKFKNKIERNHAFFQMIMRQ